MFLAGMPALGIVEESPQRGTSEDLERKARPELLRRERPNEKHLLN